ncbi:hypothetical protein RHMOL_Rhmol11G0229600 [Rhododendron molle]|uniref:Uncharacterized protein n=1 Tax=Rhododendron molle TaxID=49168 RepID=A0ACC0LVA2_RHOML|nr:hypothetical protein RHMOL_Rhmol11G0229600 [Rhododendron molle]
MDILVMILNKLWLCVSSLWELQEMRFSAIFDDASSFTMTVIMAAISSVMAARRR